MSYLYSILAGFGFLLTFCLCKCYYSHYIDKNENENECEYLIEIDKK